MSDLVSAYEAGDSASSIARLHGVSVWSVLKRLRMAGIAIRKNQNERHLAAGLLPIVELVDGLLLGDGQIDPKGILHLEQSLVRLGWQQQLMGFLVLAGAESKLIPIPPRTRRIENRTITSKGGYVLYTPAYVEFQTQRVRWYPGGIKRVPPDLRLTPLVLAQWLAGDGTAHGCGGISFCTQGFLETEVRFLVDRLETDLGICGSVGRSHRPGQFLLNVHRLDEAMKIKILVSPWLPECCQYKLRKVRPRKGKAHG